MICKIHSNMTINLNKKGGLADKTSFYINYQTLSHQ
ncbi:hypothetical protein MGSAQ_000892 [marine sediment metagenome]|uniref:Uncharacterized protein n=1 Tax=marine sediment metagenome TaxID=412755 RepID=A0A1B6NXB7_9ZZZZ